MECRILRADGSVRWVEGRVGLLFENGSKTAVCGTLMDVTERARQLVEIQTLNNHQEELVERRTEELRNEIAKRESIQAELEFNEAKHRNTIDSEADAIFSVDLEGRITSANQAVETIFGFCLKTLIGHLVSVLMNESVAESHQSWIQHYLEAGDSSIIGQTSELEGRRFDGSLFPIELSVSEVSTAGIRSFTAIIRDITKRKAAEQEVHRNAERLREKEAQLRSTISNAPAGIILTDKDMKIVVVNDQLRDILDVPQEMMEAGKNYADDIRYVSERGDYGSNIDEHRSNVLESLKTPNARPFEYISTAGNAFSVRRHPVGDGSVVTIAMDVTEQKQAEERLRQALCDLELAQDELV
ncbi:PAS domain S-box protein [Nisaea sp.]|uniref:PAS domain-containing protein n=1 Tax=Nisaea sp. TaxID=2024842 RepID=UPI0032976BAA